MVLLVVPVKCKTMAETNLLCVGCSVLCQKKKPLFLGLPIKLCSSSSKAIWALLVPALMRCAPGRFVHCDFKRILLAVALVGADSLAFAQLSGAPVGRSPPSHRPEPLALPASVHWHGGCWAGTLSSAVSRAL